MMAAEAGGEEGGSASAAGEPGHCPALCRGKGPQGSGGGSPGGGGGPPLCPALGLLVLGPAPPAGGGGAVAAGQGQEMPRGALAPQEPGSTGGPLAGGFPPLPLVGGLGTVDEGDSLDGPEYEEEEVAIPLNAPPTNQWYHGKLDRTIAEERLRQAGKPGSYLIRESDRRPGSFVLSFLSKTNVVNHFRPMEALFIPFILAAFGKETEGKHQENSYRMQFKSGTKFLLNVKSYDHQIQLPLIIYSKNMCNMGTGKSKFPLTAQCA